MANRNEGGEQFPLNPLFGPDTAPSLVISRHHRAQLKAQKPCCLWFTGLSGSGKTTIATLLEARLCARSRHTMLLDGDLVRRGLNRDLGYTDAARTENVRRVAEVARLMMEAGLITLVAMISPFRAERQLARSLFVDGEFLEIYLDTPLAICESRDPKGHYKKARAGELANFTGITSPYEPPEAPDLRLDTERKTPEQLVADILAELDR